MPNKYDDICKKFENHYDTDKIDYDGSYDVCSPSSIHAVCPYDDHDQDLRIRSHSSRDLPQMLAWQLSAALHNLSMQERHTIAGFILLCVLQCYTAIWAYPAGWDDSAEQATPLDPLGEISDK